MEEKTGLNLPNEFRPFATADPTNKPNCVACTTCGEVKAKYGKHIQESHVVL